MELFTEEQKQEIAAWARKGMALAAIQKQIEKTFGQRMTYMDIRLLLDDLAVALPKNEKKPVSVVQDLEATEGVTVTSDKIQPSGAVASGSVIFSDGEKATWQIDAYGRLALTPVTEGYTPKNEDLQTFQEQLKNELRKSGF